MFARNQYQFHTQRGKLFHYIQYLINKKKDKKKQITKTKKKKNYLPINLILSNIIQYTEIFRENLG